MDVSLFGDKRGAHHISTNYTLTEYSSQIVTEEVKQSLFLVMILSPSDEFELGLLLAWSGGWGRGME